MKTIIIKNKQKNKFNFKINKILLTIFFLINLTTFTNSSSVCDLELLIMELKQDLEDNGILDCLR